MHCGDVDLNNKESRWDVIEDDCRKIEVPENATHFKEYRKSADGDLLGKCCKIDVLAIRQIHCTVACFSSNDVWVCRTVKGVENLEGDGESELIGHPVESMSIKKGQVQVWLKPDPEFYRRLSPYLDWSQTEEFKAHVARYLAEGWEIYAD
jgi:hypothetical protein